MVDSLRESLQDTDRSAKCRLSLFAAILARLAMVNKHSFDICNAIGQKVGNSISLRWVALCTIAMSQWLLKSPSRWHPGEVATEVWSAAVPRSLSESQLHWLVDLIAHIGARRGLRRSLGSGPHRAELSAAKEKKVSQWGGISRPERGPHWLDAYPRPGHSRISIFQIRCSNGLRQAHPDRTHPSRNPVRVFSVSSSPTFRQHEVPTGPHHWKS
jgi:hypothetical protein